MSADAIKQRLQDEMKLAMRAKDKERLSVIRMIQAAFKQVEVDERVEIDDPRALAILGKMLKQRKESVTQYQQAGRQDLASKEQAEMVVIQEFLPEALSQEKVQEMVKQVILNTGAKSMQDMSKIMAVLKPQLEGRADMAEVSKLVKAHLS